MHSRSAWSPCQNCAHLSLGVTHLYGCLSLLDALFVHCQDMSCMPSPLSLYSWGCIRSALALSVCIALQSLYSTLYAGKTSKLQSSAYTESPAPASEDSLKSGQSHCSLCERIEKSTLSGVITVAPRPGSSLGAFMIPSLATRICSAHLPICSQLPLRAAVDWLQATLEEVVEADLLLHVLDASSLHVDQQRNAVLQVSLISGTSAF